MAREEAVVLSYRTGPPKMDRIHWIGLPLRRLGAIVVNPRPKWRLGREAMLHTVGSLDPDRETAVWSQALGSAVAQRLLGLAATSLARRLLSLRTADG
jgi:hypothetical protein